jgi:hypothetical protein
LLFVALEQRSSEMPLALSFIGGTQRHERRLAFTLSETIVMTRLASSSPSGSMARTKKITQRKP